ncbi:TetR family transcriptional regulator [Spirosoma sp. HMF3257]|uniref:TetR/AcrR family transcriptional regulator n=1 Tax=Spirosoma telluris TaxID=2183553 RepID=A0A327NFA3_9BACT|nr:TetR family transcriptional regulator [Spirosoma telluris]RAI73575.1 TetR/AcrR family transcriptional regulator [Spirosoma telluris]
MKTSLPEPRPSETRERIIDTASRLFYKQGYNLTGINQLIDEAGVAKASLYQHFSSKEELLIAYLTKTSSEWFIQLNSHVAPYDTPKAKVLAAFDLLLNFSEEVSFRGCNFQNIISEVPQESESVRAVIRNHKARMRQFFTDLLAETAQAELADAVTVLFEGALIAGQMQQDVWPVQSAGVLIQKIL